MFTIHADPLGQDSFTADVRISVISLEPASSTICRVQVLDSEELPVLDDPSLEELSLYEKDILRIPGRRFPLTVSATECGTNKVFQGGPFLTNAEICFPNLIECAKIGIALGEDAAQIKLHCTARALLQPVRDALNTLFLLTVAAVVVVLGAAFAAAAIPFVGAILSIGLFVAAGFLAKTAADLKQKLDNIDQQIADHNTKIQEGQNDYSAQLEKARANCCPLTDLVQQIPTC